MTPPAAVDSGPRAAPTVASVLRDAGGRLGAAGIATARQDAEALLARVLGATRLALHVNSRAPVEPAALRVFEALVARRLRQEPLQYLLGEAEFGGLVLTVGPGVFVPRPETEGLVERALALVLPAAATVVDLCAGSGAIACALARRRPGWTVWAVEQAREAAAYARANVGRLGLGGRVRVLEGDLFEPLAGRVPRGGLDLVVANPPYLARPLLAGLPAEVRDWEPRPALDGGADGLAVIRPVLAAAAEWLRPGGALLVEIGEEHGPPVSRLMAEDPRYDAHGVHRDFLGRDRVLEGRRR